MSREGSHDTHARAEAPERSAPLELSVLVVSFNTRALLLECLEALFATTAGIELETIVFDNASEDGSADAVAQAYPSVRLVRSPENLGFAGANNRAAALARAPHLLLLNPDTRVHAGAVASTLAFARAHPELGAVGGRTLFADGSLNPSSCWGRPTLWSLFCHGIGLTVVFRRNPLFDPESLGRWARDTERGVDIVSGCFLLMATELWRHLEGFDEDFFMYGEDADLCLRAAALGRPCRITPDALLVHHGGASERVRADKMVRLFQAKAQLFAKHWSPMAARFGTTMLDAWAATRALAFGVAGRLRRKRVPGTGEDKAATWRDIWRRRKEWSLSHLATLVAERRAQRGALDP